MNLRPVGPAAAQRLSSWGNSDHQEWGLLTTYCGLSLAVVLCLVCTSEYVSRIDGRPPDVELELGGGEDAGRVSITRRRPRHHGQDLIDLMITHPLATLYWQLSGKSTVELRINDGHLLVVMG